METVLRIIEAGSALDVILRLSTDERLLASVEMAVDPDEPDPDTFELLSWALNRFQPMECKVTQTGDTVATFDGQRHELTAVEAAGPVHGDPRPDGEAPVAGILGTVLFDAMEHLRAVHVGDAGGYDPQAAPTTIADLGVPDCDLTRRLHVDLTPVVDTAAVGEEVMFLATADERLLVLTTHSSRPAAAAPTPRYSIACGSACCPPRHRRLSGGPAILTGRTPTMSKPWPSHRADRGRRRPDPRRTRRPGPAGFAVGGEGRPAGRHALHPSHRPGPQRTSTSCAQLRCGPGRRRRHALRAGPGQHRRDSRQPVRHRRGGGPAMAHPCDRGGLDASHEPVAVVGMLLLDTADHLRSLHCGEASVYDPPHLATVGRALRSPMWVSSELLRTEPEAQSTNPPVELVWVVVPEAFYVEDGDGGKEATVIVMPHDPLGDDPVSDATRTLFVDLRRRALSDAAAELATIEHQRPKSRALPGGIPARLGWDTNPTG